MELTIGSWTEEEVQVVTGSDPEDAGQLQGRFVGDALRIRLRPTVNRVELRAGEPLFGHFYEISLEYQFESALPREGTAGANWTPATPVELATIRTFVE